jgi:hypothetical protein
LPTFLFGLPLHPLAVHAVVVLVPVAVLGCLVVALWPAARRRSGVPVAVLTLLAAVSLPIATSTGEGLERNLPRTDAIRTHAELGDQLLVFVGPLFVVVAALVLLDRLRRRDTVGGPGTTAAPRSWLARSRVLSATLMVLTVALAVVSAVQVVRIGDSGARAAWGSVQYSPQPFPGGSRPG